MIGCYYLHTNGELIFKNASAFFNTTPAEYFEGNFVVMWWVVPKKPPADSFEECALWVMEKLSQAYKQSSDKRTTERCIRQICKAQGFPDMIANAIIEGKGATVCRAENGAPIGIATEEGKAND